MKLDVVKEELAKFIRWVMRDVTYHRLYPCTVQGQDGDGLLALLPDDDEIHGQGLVGIRIAHGIPGLKVTVKPGARVMLGFAGGDPKKPYAALWDAPKDAVVVVEFPGQGKPIARMGDPVLVFINPAVPIPMNGTVGGAPFVGTILITTPVNGIIQAGNPQVLG